MATSDSVGAGDRLASSSAATWHQVGPPVVIPRWLNLSQKFQRKLRPGATVGVAVCAFTNLPGDGPGMSGVSMSGKSIAA